MNTLLPPVELETLNIFPARFTGKKNIRRPLERVAAWRGIAMACVASATLALVATSRGMAQEPKQNTPAPAAPAKQDRPSVTIKVDVFEITDADAKKLGLIDLLGGLDSKKFDYKETLPTGVVSPTPGGGILEKTRAETLRGNLNKAESMKLLATPGVTTLSGQRAVMEIVREVRYPTEFTVDPKTSRPFASAFETRNIGLTVEVEPVVGPKQEIQLVMMTQLVTFLGFINYGEQTKDKVPGDAPKAADMPETGEVEALSEKVTDMPAPSSTQAQPIFSTRKITTMLTVNSGQSVLFGGLRSERAKGRLIFFLATASILPASGNSAQP